MTSAPSIGFDYQPSRWPGVLLLAMGALALVAIADSGLAWWIAILLGLVVIVHVHISLGRTRERKVHRVTWRADGGWQLHLADDSEAEAELLNARVVAGVILLRLAWPMRGRDTLLLFPDNLDADTRRRLRMRLSVIADTG